MGSAVFTSWSREVLSFAVQLVDGFTEAFLPATMQRDRVLTGTRFSGSRVATQHGARVWAEDSETGLCHEARSTPSGFYVFTELRASTYRLKVESRFHFLSEQEISLPVPDRRVPTVVRLEPSYDYPFPRRATLIRGVVEDADQSPVAWALVTLVGSELQNRTDNTGRFVIHFETLGEEDVVAYDGRRYLQLLGSTELTLLAEHDHYGSGDLSVSLVEESSSTLLENPIKIH